MTIILIIMIIMIVIIRLGLPLVPRPGSASSLHGPAQPGLRRESAYVYIAILQYSIYNMCYYIILYYRIKLFDAIFYYMILCRAD